MKIIERKKDGGYVRKFQGSGKFANSSNDSNGYGIKNMTTQQREDFYKQMEDLWNRHINTVENINEYFGRNLFNYTVYDNMEKAGQDAAAKAYNEVFDYYLNEGDDEDYRPAIEIRKKANNARAAAMMPYAKLLDEGKLFPEYQNYVKSIRDTKNQSIDQGVDMSKTIPSAALTLAYGLPALFRVPYLGRGLLIGSGVEAASDFPKDLVETGIRAYNGNLVGTFNGWNPFNEEENAGALGSLLGATLDLTGAGYGASQFKGALNSNSGRKIYKKVMGYAPKMGDYMWKHFPNYMQNASNTFYNNKYGSKYLIDKPILHETFNE